MLETIGRYRPTGLLGEGAMGRVLLAVDTVLEREVALKHLRPELVSGRCALDAHSLGALHARMRNEAKAAARVSHPSLVALYDLGEHEELGVFLVFERVEGPTLRQRLARGPLPPVEVGRMAAGLGDGLTTAHEAGIVHRDVKPENVILSRTGAKLADFGIARVPGSRLTAETLLFGTLAYSAPETLEGAGFSPLSDQFALSATAYEALAGEPVFGGDDPVEVAHAVATRSPAPVAARLRLGAAVDEVLARGLALEPKDRFPSCRAFGAALQQALLQQVPSPQPDPAPDVRARVETSRAAVDLGSVALRRERSPLQVGLGIAAVVAVGALVWRAARLEAAPAAPAASERPADSRAPCSGPAGSARPSQTSQRSQTSQKSQASQRSQTARTDELSL